VDNIVDKQVRLAVQEKIQFSGKSEPKEVFAKPEDHPHLLAKKGGRKIPIHKVRIRKKEPTITLGENERTRYAASAENHHIEVVAIKDKKGNEKWEGHVVSLYEAVRRKQKGEPVVKRDFGEGKEFLFSLRKGDSIMMENENGIDTLFVVCGISQFTSGAIVLDFRANTDARPITKIPRQGRTKTPDVMRKANARKIVITPLGEVRWAND
jgi:hypothetical protein